MADLSSLLGAAGIGGAIGKAIVSLELDTAKYQGELKTAQASTVSSTNSMGSSFSKLGGFAKTAMLGVGVAVVAGAAVAVKAAIDLNEQINKTKVVFEDSADSVLAFSETTASSLGISQRAALEAAGSFGQMFDAAGLVEAESAKMSERLVGLASDLASFNNIDPTVALDKLQGGLAGMARPLREVGVFLSAARVETEAYESGIAAVGEELTDAQKIQARYNIILADTQKAQGDFARTIGDSIPNQIRKMKAELEDAAAKIGQVLLPVMLDLTKAITDNIDQVEKLTGALRFLLDAYGKIAQIAFTPWEVAGAAMESLGHRVDDLNLKFPELQLNLDVMKAKAALAEAGISNLTDAVDHSRVAARSAGTEWTGLSKAGKEIADGLREELPDIIGTVTKYKDVFDLSPAELVDLTAEWVKIGKKMARDLREIAESDLSPAMKEAISALPPEMRAAWADGNAKQKGAIERSIRDAYNIKEELDKIANDAAGAAREIGRNIASGIALGITTSSELITVAAASAVHRAIEAARAEAKVKSPSEVMRELGLDMMEGLYIGITKGAQKVIDASRKSIEKTIDTIGSELDKVKGKAADFTSTIRAGFAEFLDIGGAFGSAEEGTTLSDIIASRVAGAQQLADVLNALKAQGAGKALLSQVAESGVSFGQALLQGGPDQVAEANAALQTIADLAQLTGKGLSEAFFGEKTDRLEAKLDRLHDDLRDLRELEREGNNIAIILDGQKVGEAVRGQLVRSGSRNPNIFGGRA